MSDGGNASEWTVNTLKEHFTALFHSYDAQYEERFNSQQDAIRKAESAIDRRLEGVNEFRQTLSDQQGTYIPRLEALALIKSIEEKIEVQRVLHDKSADSTIQSLSDIRLAMTRLLSLEVYETRHSELQQQVNELRESRSETSGKSVGAQHLWGYMVGAIAVTGTIVALISHFIK